MSLVELALSVVVAVFVFFFLFVCLFFFFFWFCLFVFFFFFWFCLFVCGLNPFLGPPQCLGYICPDHRAIFGLLF